jgi:hypothetical protein
MDEGIEWSFSLIGFLQPQNTQPNPNCLQNAVVGSPGIGRPFDAAPGPNGRVFHDGPHALSPANAANAVTLPALAGEVIYKNVQEYTTDSRGRKVPALYTVDVRPTNGNFIVVYKDLTTVSVGVRQMLAAGDVIGTVRPAGDPKSYIGLHVALVRPEFYDAFRRETKAQARQNRLSTFNTRKMFIDPLGPGGLLRCP